MVRFLKGGGTSVLLLLVFLGLGGMSCMSGCGSGGKNITTENISAHNLINIQRVTRRKLNQKWFDFDTEKLLDESNNEETILSEYNKNS